MLDGLLQKELSTKTLFRHLVRKLLKNKGVSLEGKALKKVTKRFLSLSEESEEFYLPIPVEPGSIYVTEQDRSAAMSELDEGLARIPELLAKTTAEEVPQVVLGGIRASAKATLKIRKKHTAKFVKQVGRIWKKPLSKLELLIAVAQEAQQTFVEDCVPIFRKVPGAERERLLETLNVLTGVHVRACRTAWEVLTLLRSGYADGAIARWRSLYELNIVLLFLVKHQGDLPLRYRRHGVVEEYNRVKQHQAHWEALGLVPYTTSELSWYEREAEAEKQRYGNHFRHDFGWAAHLLHKEKVGLSDLADSLDLQHWKPYYKMGCNSVHAGAQALFWSLGGEDRSLPDASSRGLADPGSLTAISLTQASIALLSFQGNTDALIASRILQTLSDEINQEFLEVEERYRPRRNVFYPSREMLRGKQSRK